MAKTLRPKGRPVLRLHMAAEQVGLVLIAESIASLAERECWAHELCFQIDLILEELVQNVISYGYPDGRVGTIDIAIDQDETSLSIRIEDDGIAFDPLSLPAPDTDVQVTSREIGGLGVHFARVLTDEQSYCRSPKGNCVELVKYLPVKARE